MVSSRLEHEITGFDEIVRPGETDFEKSWLKVASLLRIGRLAAVNKDILVGRIGEIDTVRLLRIKRKLAEWLGGG
jgi:mRNA interferase MazF